MNASVKYYSLRIKMSSKRLLASIAFQLERASCKHSLRNASSITYLPIPKAPARPLLLSQRCLRRLSTTSALRLQEAQPSATTTSTSPKDPNKAASAESTAATSTAADPPQSKIYSYEDILAHTSSPSDHPNRILIDVREPAELQATGYIPTAINIPITSSPDAFFLPETEFEDRFGIPRPSPDTEVVFYCRAGVRSRAAARMAAQAEPRFGGKVGEFPGSWLEWEGRGGTVERK
jgi:rhodanese-related sulfurtransferase